MEYKVNIPEFEGPLDLLLHLIKQENIDIYDINIEHITKQYLDYIKLMEELNLNIASEYLVMAAELLQIKSNSLLPKNENTEDEFEENTRETLIKKLLDYEQYKNISLEMKKLEEYRQNVYTKDPDNLSEFIDNTKEIDYGVSLNELLDAFSKLLEQKESKKPLNTKITNKEYSISKRCLEIKKILKSAKKINFKDLFETFNKEYVVVTFLAILSMSRNQEIIIEQENNFNNIIIKGKGESEWI